MESVQYGTQKLEFNLKRSDRKTLGLEVHPDLSLWAIAPIDASIDEIKQKVLKRALWINKQKQFFEQFLPRNPEREYVSGETHFYLGKRYLLKVRKEASNEVKLKHGCFYVNTKTSSSEEVKRILASWYYQHAQKKFTAALNNAFKMFKSDKISLPELEIRRMKNRWGSCIPKGKIILNPELIKASPNCIDYVIIHELCHLVENNHSKQFYELLSNKLPNWKIVKHKLETLNI